MSLGHLFKNVPDLRGLALNELLGGTHSVHVAKFFEATNDERLEQHESHLLRKTTLVKLELRSDHDDGTTRVVDSLTEQVLTEASTLTLEHVGERLESTVTSTGHSATMTTVIKQGVDRFLKHALLVADNNVRRLKLKEVLETVVSVDDTTVEVVKVGSCKTASFKRNKRTEIRRNHG